MTEMSLSDVVNSSTPGDPPRRVRRAAVKRRQKRRRRTGASLLIVLLLVGGGIYAAYLGLQPIISSLREPDDYPGPGTGEVQVRIPERASLAAIGAILSEQDVVKTTKAFVSAAEANPAGKNVQPGTYVLRKQMSGAGAVAMMLDPAARIVSKVTLREGLRTAQIVDLLAKNTKIPKAEWQAALKDPEAIGLPASAKGRAEGYLFPATYTLEPGQTAQELLSAMVERAQKVLREAGVPESREREVLIKASIVQAEATRADDFPKISRVIENRLKQGRKLEMDSTVHYASGRFKVFTPIKDTKIKSPYNTYYVRGLPAGPIGNPGQEAIDAVLRPAKGSWIFFVAVNPDTGETKYAVTEEQFAKLKEELNAWIRANPGR